MADGTLEHMARFVCPVFLKPYHILGGRQREWGEGGVHGSSDVIALIKLGVEVAGGLDV